MFIINRNQKEPLYVQIEKLIIEKIEKDSLKPGDKLPSERELCEMLNVSPGTLKQALNNLARRGILERIQGAGTFVKRETIIEREPTTCRDIALVIFDFPGALGPERNTWIWPILDGVQRFTSFYRYNPHVWTIQGRSLRSEGNELIQSLIEKNQMKGFIFGSPVESEDFKYLEENNVPFVMVGNDYRSLDIPSVVVDFYSAGKEITELLISQGHQDIGFVTNPIERDNPMVYYSAEQLFDGYRAALQDAGIAFDPINCKTIDKSIALDAERDLSREFFELSSKSTAIITNIAQLQNNKFAIKEVKSRSGSEEPLTVVNFKWCHRYKVQGRFIYIAEELGERAMKMLNTMIEGEELEEKKVIISLHSRIKETLSL